MFDDKYCLAQYWNANDCIATFAHLYISLIFPNLIYLIFAASLVRRGVENPSPYYREKKLYHFILLTLIF